MRAINLIPQDARRGDLAPSRTGMVPFLIVGMLAAALIGVIALVLTGSKIEQREADIVALEEREAAAVATAEALRPYAEFAALASLREQTVDELAKSRFDWERVLNELALILPSDVWLTGLTGTVSPDVQAASGASSTSRAEILGPALEIVGCAASQDAVANLVATLQDIDGVTRVGLERSERRGAEGGGGEDGGEECRTRDFIAKFQLVVAFDSAVVAPGSVTPQDAPEPSESAAEVEDGQAAAKESVAEGSDDARDAARIAAEVTP